MSKTYTRQLRVVIVRERRFRWAWSVEESYGYDWRPLKVGVAFTLRGAEKAARYDPLGNGGAIRREVVVATECRALPEVDSPDPLPSKHLGGDTA